MECQTEKTALLHNTVEKTSAHLYQQADNDEVGLTHPAQGNITCKVYKSRWYMLMLFSMICMLQSYLCIIWSVTAVSEAASFGWTDSDVSRIVNWNPIFFLVGIIPFIGISTFAGFRVAVIIEVGFLLGGCICRCISFQAPLVTHLADAGQMLNGLAGPVSVVGAILVSDRWFPPNERVTATGIGFVISFGGYALCFLIGPHVVPQPLNLHDNVTNITIPEMIHGLKMLRYSECGIVAFVFILVLVYFPDRPKLPPSISAMEHKQELNLWQSTKHLFCNKKNKDYWLVAVSLAVSGGVADAWTSVLDIMLYPLGVSQVQAGYFGFVAGFTGIIGTIVVGKIAGRILGHHKLLLLLFMTITVLSTYWSLLLVVQYIPYNTGSMYTVIVLWGVSSNAMVPLMFELMVESAYPVPAVVSSGVSSILFKIPNVLSLFILSLPNFPIWTLTWAVFLSYIIAFFLILITKQNYNRLEKDLQNNL